MNFITGDKFKSIAEDFLDQSKPFLNLAKKPRIIFLFTDWVDAFKKQILPSIDYEFKLITHNADMGVYEKDLDLLNDRRLIRWFGMNCHIEHEKLTPIPIGMANEKWPHGDEKLLQKIIDLNLLKKNKIYCNFDISTSPIRQQILNQLKDQKDIDFEFRRLNQEDYWKTLASYKYVISPPGNGVDCHRIWESLYLKTIPICLDCVELKSFNLFKIKSFKNFQITTTETNFFNNCEIYDFDYWESIIKL